jgi:hypothetical protein
MNLCPGDVDTMFLRNVFWLQRIVWSYVLASRNKEFFLNWYFVRASPDDLNAVFWNVTSCGSFRNRGSEGKYRLHHHGENYQWARNWMTLRRNFFLKLLVNADFVLSHRSLSTWCWRWYFHLKILFLQKPHGVTFKKTALFMATAVRTSNLTEFILLS